MRWTHWMRQLHRWLSAIFTLAVLANFVAMATVGDHPIALYIGMGTLVPLFGLLGTGVFLFFLPYWTRWRRREP